MRYRKIDINIFTEARVNTDAHVLIFDGDTFNSLDHYAELDYRYQTYKRTKKYRALRIYGEGEKMGGKYTYDIRPIRPEDRL